MSLYGRTDSNENLAKAALALGCAYSSEYDILFVSEAEAQLAVNKARGIIGPGYWAYLTYTDADGNTRHKSELIVALANADGTETQSDDTVLADLNSTISIGTPPADQTEAEGDPAAFTVAATATSGSVVYLWQRKSGASGRWTNITSTLDGSVYTGFTTNTLAISDVTGLDGYEYRVKLTSTAGAVEVISEAASLTVTP
jgi:hypothetical protein